jgi:hypothetical protein
VGGAGTGGDQRAGRAQGRGFHAANMGTIETSKKLWRQIVVPQRLHG